MKQTLTREEINKAFYLSRIGAIVRCTSIVMDSGRKDLAKQIIAATKIDREEYKKMKAALDANNN